MRDALGVLQTSVTKTATFNGTGLALPNGTPRRGLVASIDATAFSAATGTSTVTFSIDFSSDAGTTWATLASAPPILASATAVNTEIFIGFVTPLSGGNNINTQVRLTSTFSGSGVTTPTITYDGYLTVGEP